MESFVGIRRTSKYTKYKTETKRKTNEKLSWFFDESKENDISISRLTMKIVKH